MPLYLNNFLNFGFGYLVVVDRYALSSYILQQKQAHCFLHTNFPITSFIVRIMKYLNINFIFGIFTLILTSATISETYSISTFLRNYKKSINSKIINIRASNAPSHININNTIPGNTSKIGVNQRPRFIYLNLNTSNGSIGYPEPGFWKNAVGCFKKGKEGYRFFFIFAIFDDCF